MAARIVQNLETVLSPETAAIIATGPSPGGAPSPYGAAPPDPMSAPIPTSGFDTFQAPAPSSYGRADVKSAERAADARTRD